MTLYSTATARPLGLEADGFIHVLKLLPDIMEPRKRPRRLSKKERDALETLMELRDPTYAGPLQASITRLHGFLTSTISGPLVRFSEWMPVVFRSDESEGWETLRQAKRAMTLTMRFNNEIALDLMEEAGPFRILIDRIGDPPDTVDFVDDWCNGYVAGMDLRRDEWKPALAAPELEDAFAPIMALAHPELGVGHDPFDHPGEYAALTQQLPQSAVDIYDWWRTPRPVRRSTPKISANAPCPCGSGKKYKRCCSPVRST
jgi:uncharacterized protein